MHDRQSGLLVSVAYFARAYLPERVAFPVFLVEVKLASHLPIKMKIMNRNVAMIRVKGLYLGRLVTGRFELNVSASDA